MASKTDLLKNVSIFSNLEEKELKAIAGLSRYYTFRKGEPIYGKGSHREEILIIKKGGILISREEKDGSKEDLARFVAGESFGELELLDKTPRKNSAVAVEDTTLLIFPMKGMEFRKVLNRYPKIFAVVLHDLLALIAGRIRSTNRLISEKAPWVQGLRLQLVTDKLTGLLNRTFIDEDFHSQLNEYKGDTSVVMIKPDNFKDINDTFGHETGDRFLELIADTIKSSVRSDDIAARYRGDEFVVILPDTGRERAFEIARKILSAFGRLDTGYLTEGKKDTLTVSIGVSTCPVDASESKALIQEAFDRMIEIQKSGGNGINAKRNTRR
ncbi:MAG: GGDEF domain-containing protein [Spirochaetes bacterium]|nr:GGDEF domain-containing protein [Spirochaetota bacterium]